MWGIFHHFFRESAFCLLFLFFNALCKASFAASSDLVFPSRIYLGFSLFFGEKGCGEFSSLSDMCSQRLITYPDALLEIFWLMILNKYHLFAFSNDFKIHVFLISKASFNVDCSIFKSVIASVESSEVMS